MKIDPLSIRLAARAAKILQPAQSLGVIEWCSQEIDYARVKAYDIDGSPRWTPTFMPWLNQIMEDVTDPAVREVYVLKSSRAGVSEQVILNTMRHKLATNPAAMMYVTADLDSAKSYFRSRVIDGFNLSPTTAKLLKRARVNDTEIQFEACKLKAAWSTSTGSMKGEGFEVLYLDELSTYKNFALDVFKKRVETYTYSTIVGVSSPDAKSRRSSDEDPIFGAYNSGNQATWMCPDPVTGKEFEFLFGGKDTAHGLKWNEAKDEEDNWLLNEVKSWYITPCGTRIEEEDRLRILRKGRWVVQNPVAPDGVHSYRLNNFQSPFSSFDDIAKAFLRAVADGPVNHRVFRYEYLAQPWDDAIDTVEAGALLGQSGGHVRKQRLSTINPEAYPNPGVVVAGVDMQLGSMWIVAREWMPDGTSALIDYANPLTWDDLGTFCRDNEVTRVYIDNHFAARQVEVLEMCMKYQWTACYGSANLKETYRATAAPAWKNSGRGAQTVRKLSHNSNTLKDMLQSLIDGRKRARWLTYDNLERLYVSQMTAEVSVNGKWTNPKGRANHIFDCEVLSMLGALDIGILDNPNPQNRAKATPRARVSYSPTD